MEDIRAVPEPAGAGFEHIVRRKTYITGAADFNTARSAMERRSTSPVAGTGAVPGLVSSSARAGWTSLPRCPAPDRFRRSRSTLQVSEPTGTAPEAPLRGEQA